MVRTRLSCSDALPSLGRPIYHFSTTAFLEGHKGVEPYTFLITLASVHLRQIIQVCRYIILRISHACEHRPQYAPHSAVREKDSSPKIYLRRWFPRLHNIFSFQ